MKRTKLTRRDALVICRDLWGWLAKNPNYTHKSAWPGWEKVCAKYGDMASNCPCCAFVGVDLYHRPNCRNCPLDRYAWNSLYHNADLQDGFGCERDPRSPFSKWYWSDSGAEGLRARSARKIADASVKALADLRGESVGKRAALTTRRSR